MAHEILTAQKTRLLQLLQNIIGLDIENPNFGVLTEYLDLFRIERTSFTLLGMVDESLRNLRNEVEALISSVLTSLELFVWEDDLNSVVTEPFVLTD